MKALLGTKVGMTQILQEDGILVPVTIIQAGPCTVTQIKDVDNDGYTPVQIGFGNDKNLGKAVKGHVKAAKYPPAGGPQPIREIRVDELPEGIEVSSSLYFSTLAVVDVFD